MLTWPTARMIQFSVNKPTVVSACRGRHVLETRGGGGLVQIPELPVSVLTDQFREAVNCHINTGVTQMVFV